MPRAHSYVGLMICLAAQLKAIFELDFDGVKVDGERQMDAWKRIEHNFPREILRRRPAGDKLPDQIRFVFVSDTHNRHNEIKKIPLGDVLVFAGDISYNGRPGHIESFINWISALPHRHKIVIAGNHDIMLENGYRRKMLRRYYWYGCGTKWGLSRTPFCDIVHTFRSGGYKERIRRALAQQTAFTYLEYNSTNLLGYNIYGYPGSPVWQAKAAFQTKRGAETMKELKVVPESTDIMVSHGPALGFGDNVRKNHFGSASLLHELVYRIKPVIHASGHIHEGAGIAKSRNITFINAAVVGTNYVLKYNGVVVDLPRKP